MLHDFRAAARGLLRRPGDWLVATALIGPTIGAAAVALSLYHTLLVQPLPFPNADRLVEVWQATTPNVIRHRWPV